jgi:hypothetical protein
MKRRTFLRGALAVLVGAVVAPAKTIEKVIKVPFRRYRKPMRAIDYYFPIVRAHFPNLIAQDIVSVQPMTRRTGEVFYLQESWLSKLRRWWYRRAA